MLTTHVTYCGGDLPGALVELLLGTTVVGSCTTDSTGICTIPIPDAGTYTLRASRLHYTTQEFAASLTCANATRFFTLIAAPGYVNLTTCPEPFAGAPTTLRFALTDYRGTIELDYSTQFGSGTDTTYSYIGCRSFMTRWGRNEDCTGDVYGGDFGVTSAAYYLLSLKCGQFPAVQVQFPACSVFPGLSDPHGCYIRAISAACQPAIPGFGTSLAGTGITSLGAILACPPAFALSTRWVEPIGVIKILYDLPGSSPCDTSTPLPTGAIDVYLSQI